MSQQITEQIACETHILNSFARCLAGGLEIICIRKALSTGGLPNTDDSSVLQAKVNPRDTRERTASPTHGCRIAACLDSGRKRVVMVGNCFFASRRVNWPGTEGLNNRRMLNTIITHLSLEESHFFGHPLARRQADLTIVSTYIVWFGGFEFHRLCLPQDAWGCLQS